MANRHSGENRLSSPHGRPKALVEQVFRPSMPARRRAPSARCGTAGRRDSNRIVVAAMPQSPFQPPPDSDDKWTLYVRDFTSAAVAADWGENDISGAIDYANHLRQSGLPIIFDQRHVSLLIGQDIEYLRAASNAPRRFYRVFSIRKRSGTLREIAEPLPTLKRVQRWILENVLRVVPPSLFAKAYSPGCSVRDNARFHRGQRMVLRVDLADFFPTIRTARVVSLFREFGYSSSVATLLGCLCTLDGRLPQGAPTSPAISNLLCRSIDARLGSFSLKRGMRYTRYADDLIFSGDFDPISVIRFVDTVVRDSGFRMRREKTRIMYRHQRQLVTGVVVNERLQAPRQLRRKVRQDIYYIQRFGIDAHMLRCGITKAHYREHLLGILGHILYLNARDAEARKSLDWLLDNDPANPLGPDTRLN